MSNALITIFLGGGIGSVMRFGVQAVMNGRIPPLFVPWATLGVNVAGSFLIGLFYALSARFGFSDETRPFPHHGALRRVHHLLHLQPRGPDAAPSGALRRLRALHPCQRVGRHRRGTCRRVGRESPRIDNLVSTEVIPRDEVLSRYLISGT